MLKSDYLVSSLPADTLIITVVRETYLGRRPVYREK